MSLRDLIDSRASFLLDPDRLGEAVTYTDTVGSVALVAVVAVAGGAEEYDDIRRRRTLTQRITATFAAADLARTPEQIGGGRITWRSRTYAILEVSAEATFVTVAAESKPLQGTGAVRT